MFKAADSASDTLPLNGKKVFQPLRIVQDLQDITASCVYRNGGAR